MGRLDWFCKLEGSSYIGVDDAARRTCFGGSAAIGLPFIDGTSTLPLVLGPSDLPQGVIPRPRSGRPLYLKHELCTPNGSLALTQLCKVLKGCPPAKNPLQVQFPSGSTVSPCFHAFVMLRNVVAMQRVLCQDFEPLFPEAFSTRLSIMNILAK
jgi:hypothetical protein